MRAKFINEIQKFERGIDPKVAMGIGGVNLFEERLKRKLKLEKDWQIFLEKLLKGKTISGYMYKPPKINPKTLKLISKHERGDFTIKVQSWSMDNIDDNSVIIADMKNDFYSISFDKDKRIHIE